MKGKEVMQYGLKSVPLYICKFVVKDGILWINPPEYQFDNKVQVKDIYFKKFQHFFSVFIIVLTGCALPTECEVKSLHG